MIKEKCHQWIEDNKDFLINISDKIWEFAEIGFEEYKSSELLSNVLEDYDFKVEKGVAQMPTAFYATYGSKKPIIAVLGEYDALPGLSQATKPVRDPLKEGTPGHGCGHNLLGTASLGACLAIKKSLEKGNIEGTIRYYGCPAEETFNAKGYMIKHELFEDVDICLSWHPSFFNMMDTMTNLAMNSASFCFYGKSAHAAADPQNGRSALDAVELMNIGANYLREHIIPDARIHYVITNGGEAPNVVPDQAEVWYFVRAPKRHQVENIYERLLDVGNGAALMTGTKMECKFKSATYNIQYNSVVQDIMHSNLKSVGPPNFDENDVTFAKELRKTLPEDTMEGYLRFVPDNLLKIAKAVTSQPLNKVIIPPIGEGQITPGSTDVSDVSWVVPLGEFNVACEVMGSPGHSWQNVATSGMNIGHKGMLTAAKILASTAVDFMTNPELIKKAWKQFEKDHEDKRYSSPFPEGFRLSIDHNEE